MVLGGSGSPDISYKSGDPPVIEFEWTISSDTERASLEVRVPVPRGHEQEVQDLLTYFKD
jgi:hypothetical protein